MKARKVRDVFHISVLKQFNKDKFQRYKNLLPPIELEDGSTENEV